MIEYLIIILILGAFSVLSWRRIDWALMVIIGGLPLYLVRFKVFGIPSTLLEAMILIAFFCWFIFQTRFKDFLQGRYGVRDFLKNSPYGKGAKGEGRVKYPFAGEIILLLIVSFIAVGVADFSQVAFGLWKAYFFEPLLVYILILNVFKGKNGFEKIGFALAISALAISSYAIFQKITGFGIVNPLWGAEATRRVTSFFDYPNAVGLYLAPITPILLAFLFKPAKKESGEFAKKICFPLKSEQISVLGLSKGFLGLIIILPLLSIYFAKSEGAIFGLIAGFTVMALLAGRRSLVVMLSLIVIGSAGIFFYQPAHNYFEKKITLKDFSGQVRRYQWKDTLMMLNGEKKIWGIGLGNYQTAVAPYHQPGFFYDDGTDPLFHQHTVESAEYRAKTWQPVEIYLYPHNIVLNFWVELGLAGVFLFAWIIIKFIISALIVIIKDKKNSFLCLGLMTSMIVIIVHGLVDVPYFKNDLAVFFWLMVAMLALLIKKSLAKSDEEIDAA